MPFLEPAEIKVREVSDVNWDLLAPLKYRGNRDEFLVHEHMLTDFASVPRFFVWLLPRYGRYTKPAILHDYLWREKAASGELAYLDADAIFRKAMHELDVAFLRRWFMWAAVRWGALKKPGGKQGWTKEALRVVVLTVLALPIVGPPAVAIAVALALFYVVERVIWAALKLVALSRRLRGKPEGKRVNPPRLSLKL
jgi:hypothetical protein